MSSLAPIVLFTYKRLAVTRRVVESLLANREASESTLIVFSDGAKNPSDAPVVSEVRDYVRGLRGFRGVELIERPQNLGLAKSFIKGITEILARYDRAIFLEDDNLLSPHFLSFMNTGLEKYEKDQRVSCVTGYSFPIWPQPGAPYFRRGADTWSMATWRSRWSHFNPDGSELLRILDERNLRDEFNRDGFGMYEMLQQQVRGEIDSWGVRWSASAFVDDMYCLYPDVPLCVSIGYGEESVHCAEYNPLFRKPADLSERPVRVLPAEVSESRLTTILLKLMNFRMRWNQRLGVAA